MDRRAQSGSERSAKSGFLILRVRSAKMIVVDTSALMAIVMEEPTADSCSDCLALADPVLISAGTLTEALIVSRMRNRQRQMEELIRTVAPQVIAVTEVFARGAANAYETSGRRAPSSGPQLWRLLRLRAGEGAGMSAAVRRSRLRRDRRLDRPPRNLSAAQFSRASVSPAKPPSWAFF